MNRWIIGIFSLITLMEAGAEGKNDDEIFKERFNYENFNAIVNSTAADLIISRGNQYSIEVEGPSNFINALEFKQSNSQLKIDTKPMRWSFGSRKTRIYITLPALEALSSTGSGNTEVMDPFISDRFNLHLTGSGDAQLILEAEELEVTLTGSGNALIQGNFKTGELKLTGSGGLEIEGFMDKLSARLTGSGDLKGENLKTLEADLTLTGSGNLSIEVVELLNARITGSGNITYSGTPRIGELRITGSGGVGSN